MRTTNELLFSATQVVATTNSSAVDLDQMFLVDLTAVITDSTPVGGTFVDANVSTSNDTITLTGNGFVTGLKVQFSTTGTLPSPLATSTNYYVIVVDANTFKVASSLANALAGTAVDIVSAAGGGTHTVTPQALAGHISLQKSNEIYNNPGLTPVTTPTWFDVATSSQNYPGPLNWTFGAGGAFPEVGFCQFRAVAVTTSGLATISLRLNGKGL